MARWDPSRILKSGTRPVVCDHITSRLGRLVLDALAPDGDEIQNTRCNAPLEVKLSLWSNLALNN